MKYINNLPYWIILERDLYYLNKSPHMNKLVNENGDSYYRSMVNLFLRQVEKKDIKNDKNI